MSPELLLVAVELIYEAAAKPSLWPEALAAVARVFDDVGALLLWTKSDGTFGTVVSESLAAAQLDYEANGWSSRDLRGKRAVERGYFFSGEPFTDRHLCTAEEMRSDPSFTQFLARHKLGFAACIAVSPDPSTGVTLCIQRNAKIREPFSAAELDVLKRIGPHIERSLRLSIRLTDAEAISSGLTTTLSKMGIAALALDSVGNIVFSNLNTEQFSRDEVAIVQRRLRVASVASQTRIDRAIAKIICDDFRVDEATAPILIEGVERKHPSVLYLLPIRKRSLDERFMGSVRCIALLIQPERGKPADPALVRDLLGLTLGEARVASLVGFGIGPRETARKLGISEHTARYVLKRVFSKVGVSRQSELAVLLSSMTLR